MGWNVRKGHWVSAALIAKFAVSCYIPVEKTRCRAETYIANLRNPLADPHRMYEFRCPVHGFIQLNDWEKDIVSQPAFQRLRRVRQLAWTDYVYPGAMHTRFEHSLGVMHIATLLYDSVVQRSKSVLEEELAYNESGFTRDRQLVRLAALLHDVGHGPFSHGAEELMPERGDGTRYQHEQYSAAIVRECLKDAIETHPLNDNCGFEANDVAALLEGSSSAKRAVFWRELIDGQMDADRMDYLLRDSLHAGVQYGRFDLHRLVNTIVAISGTDGKSPRLGVTEGGWHAAEGLVIARYFMFTQVYFHKTRVAFDVHLQGALRELLPTGVFPKPVDGGLAEYTSWDDWKVLGVLASGEGGEHGVRLATRDHYREIYHTPESPTAEDLSRLEEVKKGLGDLVVAEVPAEKSWYKTGKADIPIVSRTMANRVEPLSKYSSVVASIKPVRKRLLYVRPEAFEDAKGKRNKIVGANDD